ncbi:MAG: nif-specific transcriptional activator NifA [Gammaproteobacteria bacterium]|nr:nif-specific transcriptional activator NifA [Gammaproteobacteria bacterium]MBU1624247.1 nif-specific transcriptional activator NifA [Gammaproteobacteria bacterium]MBU1981975.1 nif-specific transcriptional activator NifA [Gammaproteobacteria bacterium]
MSDSRNELDLLRAELETLYQVSRVLSHSLNFKQTLDGVLNALHEGVGLDRGMVSLIDAATGELQVSLVYGVSDTVTEEVSYLPGEGVVGTILKTGNSIMVDCIMDEPRFLSRMGIYNPQGAFVGVPIRIGRKVVGVLAAQPAAGMAHKLDEYRHFLEMVSNLIGQSVRLSQEVAQEKQELAEERDGLRRTVRAQYGFDNIIGHTQAMRRIFEQVRLVAKWNTTVLIRGETGTGKELIANAIHYNSPRARGSFVKLNCAALPETLLESELFGHEKGAFTGAVAQRKGRFEQAEGGTVFLDEIGEISASFQAKLLRVLQEGELERVGGTKTIKVDVRVVAATHRDLENEVERGRFREDLYYRLNVMPLTLPPLRERMEDIPDIARFLVEKVSNQQGRTLGLTEAAMRVLMHHDWPGNVRELENCLERASVMTEGDTIDRDAILLTGIDEKISASRGPVQNVDLDDPHLDERERVIAALEQAGWVQAKAARLLDMTPRQIAYRIQTLNIKVKQI